MNQFEKKVAENSKRGLFADEIKIVQVNVGLRCNQTCTHCHLSASSRSAEVMNWPTMEKVVRIVDSLSPEIVDITGGAPELNANLEKFIGRLCALGVHCQVRSNLTALLEPGLDSLAAFFRDQGISLVGSLPCYTMDNVRAQRGEGVYEKSIESIRRLNALGYGKDQNLKLDLVYNPGGAFLPGDQEGLEAAYKKELFQRFGISFNRLLTITNMPLGRFGVVLKEEGNYDKYLKLLTDSFNPSNITGLMCRHQISIGWDGALYDCDFNLALNMIMNHGAPGHIDMWDYGKVVNRRIVTDMHCFGCTAGKGSSCKGALTEG